MMSDKITICHKVRVNAGGYAYGGRDYFGAGAPLYFIEFEDGRNGHVRAADRPQAIKTAREKPGYWGIR